ncbi:hypothetical protein [Shinella zoogloeoides]|uniref:hypothetical protein n=1 Tax=Shinella zoogloeoides TaxID=352475 RepID=UPI00273E3632|nr:hypothetical protein [Shinella zoogloeoides]WLR91702.1 hypothetical protein Q9316_14575 [Shinella zoogloeoides]
MADFVAVIRRAVDGLSDNNAEMRQKVYEKARGAVRRQLESMNPRASDELVKRQLDKLEAAIVDVESDHAEALPADEPAPESVEEVMQEEVIEAEPATEEPVAVAEPEDQPVEPEPEQADEPVAEQRPEELTAEEPAAEEAVVEEPVAETIPEPEPEPEPEAELEPEPEPTAEEQVVHEEPIAVEAHVEPSWQAEATPADDYVPSWHEPEADITAEVGAETVEVVEPEPVVYPVHDEEASDAEPVAEARMPPAEAEWDWNEAAATTITAGNGNAAPVEAADPLAWEWPDDKPSQTEGAQEQGAQKSDWDDLDDLIGYMPKTEEVSTETTPAADPGFAAAVPSAAVETAARAPQRSFRAEPRKSRFNLAALAATVALLAIVGGAGAAYWINRDAVNGWVDEKIASFTAPSTEKPAETSQTSDTAEGGRSLPANTTPSNTAETTDDAAGNTEVASATQNSSGKFTQRLLTDGTEVDEGPAPALDGGAAEEGKSVAAQTTETAGVATEDGAAATGDTAGQTPAAGTDGAAQTPADTGTATTADTQTPAATGDQAGTVGVAQKMFLYEERLGQTAPTAIEGTVAWSSAEESPGGDAKPEPVVRAQINVPSKGLTALVTFRRNADKSLPASHLVELVFSLPENFEGGGIESVQRVAMKRTEQDRGDALIAVPAKITDDFHMIALNDFPEAITKNTELLRSRSWIDIPITYRNGRRALLTLDKGTAGAEAFDKVMKAWSTTGTQ